MVGIKREQLGLGDKLEFIVGLFAIIFALQSFKGQLDAIKLDILIGSFSASYLIFIFLLMLFISIYLYAINCAIYDFPKLLSVRWLRWLRHIEFFANLTYSIAILAFPLFLLIAWSVSSVIKILSLQLPIFEFIVGLLIGAITGFSAFFLQAKKNKEEKLNLAEGLEEEKQQFLIEAKEAFDKRLYNFVLVNLHNSLIKLIGSELVTQYGLEVEKISSKNLIDLATKNNLISGEELNFINDLRVLRNQIAHGSLQRKITREEASSFIRKINQIIKKRQQNCEDLYKEYRKLKKETDLKAQTIRPGEKLKVQYLDVDKLMRRKEFSKKLRKKCKVYLDLNPSEWYEIERDT